MFDADYRLQIVSILSPAEVFNLTGQILTAAAGVIPADPATLERKQFNSLSQLNGVLGTALGIGVKEDPQKDAKAAADAQRDSGFVKVKETVNGILNDRAEDNRDLIDAAAAVKRILNDYPANLHAAQYAENTAHLETLVPKLRADPVAGAIARLGLTRYVDRMFEGNEAFKQAAALSEQARSQDQPQDWASAKPVRWHGSQFASNIAYLGETEPAFASLAAQIRQTIADAEAIARARTTRRTNSRTSPDQGTPPVAKTLPAN